MNKKIMAVLAFTMAFSLVSCGSDAPDESSVNLDFPVVTTIDTETDEEQSTTETAEQDSSDSSETSTSSTNASTSAESTKTTETTVSEEEYTTEEPQEQVIENTTEELSEPDPEPDSNPEPEPTSEPEPEPAQPEPPAPTAVNFSLDNLGSNAADIIASLGEADDILEAVGCLSNGADQKVYTYDGLRVLCYIIDGTEYIYEIDITANYSTSAGITVGSSRSDVEAAYGTGEEAGNYAIYYDGNKELDIAYDGDIVTSVVLYMSV